MNELIVPKNFDYGKLLKYKELFEPQIAVRGLQYFNNGNVKSILKDVNSNSYICKVLGDTMYTTIIEIIDDNNLKMSCTCPYFTNCKHEWAALLSIESGKYKEIKLKKVEDKQSISMEKFIKKIPANMLKKFLVEESEEGYISINMDELREKFFVYLPKNDYDFYYNSLYNSIEINEPYYLKVNEYLNEIKSYLENKDYEMCYIIIKSLIEIYHDKKINIIDNLPLLGMLFRICYNKAKKDKKYEKLSKQIKTYIEKLKKADYYEDVYLEDMINNL